MRPDLLIRDARRAAGLTRAQPYDVLKANADRIEVGELPVLFASIDDLISMKRAAGRPRDLIDLEALEIARPRPD